MVLRPSGEICVVQWIPSYWRAWRGVGSDWRERGEIWSSWKPGCSPTRPVSSYWLPRPPSPSTRSVFKYELISLPTCPSLSHTWTFSLNFSIPDVGTAPSLLSPQGRPASITVRYLIKLFGDNHLRKLFHPTSQVIISTIRSIRSGRHTIKSV
ncbi:hypothetical protein JAAARDRAFT_680888 [Jaapia argillacea MUCL 33604]|uniref:Uncharacterized protein n=1 Tax=Jaapia argillacea MUCL 33604 TaxID=933084 RepID=A0A067Q5M6_9AGAM|nr:hypothetical protein JAAARDRAFT_680888 [Jaapia argillacea MUCL 33604]